ncbi:MAG: hypothetical protein JNK15_14505 [Planctomycetes bacterium]|nr:hypothetical protein [Planctomycetota bacterium]
MRRLSPFLLLVAACVPMRHDAGSSWTLSDPSGKATSCAIAATPAEWRRLRAVLGPEAAAVPEPPCDFVGTRVVVAWLRGLCVSPPVAVQTGTEEGVTVVTLVPNVRAEAGERTLVHVFVVAECPGQLAVVATLPDGAHGREQTLAVFPRH